MSDEKLLRCPFCGREVALEKSYFFWYVEHRDDNAFDDCPLVGRNSDTKEEAIAKWNRRAK